MTRGQNLRRRQTEIIIRIRDLPRGDGTEIDNTLEGKKLKEFFSKWSPDVGIESGFLYFKHFMSHPSKVKPINYANNLLIFHLIFTNVFET